MKREFSSFKDPDGFIFTKDGILYRQINCCYKKNYEKFLTSGLKDALLQKEFLIPFTESKTCLSNAYKIIKPEKISFISYPYEWCFSEYKDAALLTLTIQKEALLHGMSLKDASAYNIQFRNGRPIFIDTLSFEILEETKPWQAYKQFCQHFLAPLALMSYKDVRLSNLMKIYIDGLPLDLTSELLPFWIPPGLFLNIRLNLFFQDRYKDKYLKKIKDDCMSLKKHIILIDELSHLIENFELKSKITEWKNYYDFTNYSDQSFKEKEQIIKKILCTISPKKLWDLGANNGYFSRVASKLNIQTYSFDIDPLAVESNYEKVRKESEHNILPLIIDLLNPSPAIGWSNRERLKLSERELPDAIMALALIHHLSISNNIPFDYIAHYFSSLAKYLIIEFTQKEDTQIQKLLSSRKDVFPWYNQNNFEKDFSNYFTIIEKMNISGTKRWIYLMERIR